MTGKPPLFSIAILSSAILSCEILIIHLFAIIHYHHFASMVIGLALLGYGASGTFYALCKTWLQRGYAYIYPLCIVLFSCSALGGFFLAQEVPFHGEALLWDYRQVIYIFLIWLCLMLPFFFGATAICLTLDRYGTKVSTVYGADLLGAGLGSMAAVGLLFLLFPKYTLLCISWLALVAAAVANLEVNGRRYWGWAIVLLPIFVVQGLLVHEGDLHPSPYKTLQRSLQAKGAQVIAERSGPLGLLQVVENTQIPFRFAPGLSVSNLQEPLPQLAVFTNGESYTVITRQSKEKEALGYLAKMTSALPYHLHRPGRVLVLGVGGGADLLQAKYHQVDELVGVELNPQIIDLLRGQFWSYSGQLLDDDVEVHIDDIRGYFARHPHKAFDLIQLSLVDSFQASASGLNGISVNHIYTVESFRQYLNHLSDDGYVAITRWVKNPPRDSLKIFATAVTALQELAVLHVDRHLVLIRGWETSTLLVKKRPFSQEEIAGVMRFCERNGFDIAYSHGTGKEEANRYNIMQQPYFFDGAQALSGDGFALFIKNYKYNLTPATDDKPYFNHFFKWSAVAEILGLKASGGAALFESGYLVLLAVLGVAVVLSFFLIIVPLLLFYRRGKTALEHGPPYRILVYFLLTGVGYLLLEIGFLQKLVLLLHHPVYAISAGVAVFLVCSGLGSLLSARIAAQWSEKRALGIAVCGVLLLGTASMFGMDKMIELVGAMSYPVRLAAVMVTVGPLALCMGMPFPLALARLHAHSGHMLPWAWGINGCASVAGSLGANVLAIHVGFSGVILFALVCYGGLILCFPARKCGPTPG